MKATLASRFASFHQSLRSSYKFPVRFLAHLFEGELRNIHCKNLSKISLLCEQPVQKLTPKLLVKSKLTYFPVPKKEQWRIPLCRELLKLHEEGDYFLPGFTFDEQSELLRYVCLHILDCLK